MKIDLHFHFDSFQELNEFQAALNPPVADDVGPGVISEGAKIRACPAKKPVKEFQPNASFPRVDDAGKVETLSDNSEPAPVSLDDIRAKVSLVIEKKGLPVATKIIKAFKVSRIAELESADYGRVLKACDKVLKI